MPGSSQASRREDVRRRIAAIHGATNPPKEVLRRSMAKLHAHLSQHYRRQWALRAERDKYLLQLYAPVGELLKTDKRAAAGLRGLRRLAERALKRKPPPPPKMPKAEPRIMSGSLYTFVTPDLYSISSPQGDGSASLTAQKDGRLEFTIKGNGGGSWAWCGVGFPFMPDHDVYVRIGPLVTYHYWANANGYILTGHTDGSVGTHVHQYNRNWNEIQTPCASPLPEGDLGNFWFSSTQLYSVGSTDDQNSVEDWGSYSGSGTGLLLCGGYNYLIWAWCGGSCDDSAFQLPLGAYSIANGHIDAAVPWIVLEQLA